MNAVEYGASLYNVRTDGYVIGTVEAETLVEADRIARARFGHAVAGNVSCEWVRTLTIDDRNLSALIAAAVTREIPTP